MRRSALIGLMLAACAPETPRGPARAVVLVTCDTLRADRLGCYGYERPTSPNLDAFARECVVFDSAYACAPMTLPALSSLMTGRMPSEVGAVPGNTSLVPAEVETLAERLSAAGVTTGAVVSNWLLRRQSESPDAGLPQGFDAFDDTMTTRERNRPMFERLAPDTTDAALAWLERNGSRRPWFLWVHYQDPHGPYKPPEELAQLFDAEVPAGPELKVGKGPSGLGRIPRYQALGEERRAGVYRDRYDAEIRLFDRELGRLLDALRENGLDDALVIVSADHGESLGEHGWWFCHGETLQRELVRVPLIVRYPRGVPGPGVRGPDGISRCTLPASHLDLWPTVLEALGVEDPGSSGLSLLGELPLERVLQQELIPHPGHAAWRAAFDGRWRLVLREGSAPELYDLALDPGELRDLAAAEPERVKSLLARIQEERAAGAVRGKPLPSGPQTEEALRRLGYVGGDGH